MTWLDELNLIPLTSGDAGLTAAHGKSFGPCPKCNATKRGAEDRRGPLGLTRDDRGFKCHVAGCDAEGDFADLLGYRMFGKRFRELSEQQRADLRQHASEQRYTTAPDPHRYGVTPASHVARPVASIRSATPAVSVATDEEEVGGSFRWRDALPSGAVNALWTDPDAAPVLDYLRVGRGFADATIKTWGLGAMVRREGGKVVDRWVVIPLCDPKRVPVNVKFRSVPGNCLRCSPDGGTTTGPGCKHCRDGAVKKQYRCCANRPLPLFGAHNLTAPNAPVIPLEGELDVVAADDMGWGTNVVSGTAGAGQAWPEEWLDALEPFPTFLIAFDGDKAGNDGANQLAEKLGRYRCSRVKLPHKDLGECLVQKVIPSVIQAAFDGAAPMVPTEIGLPSDYASDIETLINNPTQLRGLQCSVQAINEMVGGFTPGLWVFTGETGEGKTTFVTWLLWDLAGLGSPVLLTSFEQQPIGTVQKLLRMELGGDFTLFTAPERAAALASLDAKGLYVVKKYGDVTDEDTVNAIRYARRRRGCRLVLIDHLDFIARNRKPGEDERQAKDRIVRDLATLGITEDIIIILICHPSNIARSQQRRVELGDVKGASSIRQDCHAGLAIEKLAQTTGRQFPAACVHADKVRSEFGQAGSKRTLAFDPLSCRYAVRWEDTPTGKKGGRIVVP